MELKEGDQAPDFSLPSNTGSTVRLQDLKGKNIVLYFYPKDDTPGCTKEACAFRDLRQKFQALGAEIFGVSFDSVDSHKQFSAKFKLPFPLLSDSDKTVAKRYGVFKKKILYGNSFLGIERTTFVIDRDSKIRNIFRRVKVEGHAESVLAAL